MEFENAKIGLRKVYNAQILSIIASIIGIVGTVVMTVLGKAIQSGAENYNSSDIISVIFLIVAGIIGIIAFILNFVGISRTSKDDESFKNALIMLVIAIAASVIGSAIQNRFPGTAKYLDYLHDLATLFVSYYVIGGCMSIAEKKNDVNLAATCKTARTFIIVAWVITIVLEFLSGAVNGFVTVIAIVGALCEIVAYIIYLVILSKTLKIL